mmetsp:Transcript_44868/g.149875  ORF Transcript_44868/g.149875 Transcript_44868/m.149875 type:complete len:207 (+) Transcript_44868:399-1019(+)
MPSWLPAPRRPARASVLQSRCSAAARKRCCRDGASSRRCARRWRCSTRSPQTSRSGGSSSAAWAAPCRLCGLSTARHPRQRWACCRAGCTCSVRIASTTARPQRPRKRSSRLCPAWARRELTMCLRTSSWQTSECTRGSRRTAAAERAAAGSAAAVQGMAESAAAAAGLAEGSAGLAVAAAKVAVAAQLASRRTQLAARAWSRQRT